MIRPLRLQYAAYQRSSVARFTFLAVIAQNPQASANSGAAHFESTAARKMRVPSI